MLLQWREGRKRALLMTSRRLHTAAWLAAVLVFGGGAAFAQSPPERDAPAVGAAISPGTGAVSSLPGPTLPTTVGVGEAAADATWKRDPFWPTGYVPRPAQVEAKAIASVPQQPTSPPPSARQ